jgi:hypothetical protein
MADLLDALADVWTDAPEWVPVYKRWDMDPLVRALTEERCRDCGRKAGHNQGGSDHTGIFMVCDDCATLDACLIRKHDRGPEWHVSHWGDMHRADEHDELARAQAKRRRAYLARQSPET